MFFKSSNPRGKNAGGVHKCANNFWYNYDTEKLQASLKSWDIENLKNMYNFAVASTVQKLYGLKVDSSF